MIFQVKENQPQEDADFTEMEFFSLWSPWFFPEKIEPEHECGAEVLLPVVNSPRVGVCGYSGLD